MTRAFKTFNHKYRDGDQNYWGLQKNYLDYRLSCDTHAQWMP